MIDFKIATRLNFVKFSSFLFEAKLFYNIGRLREERFNRIESSWEKVTHGWPIGNSNNQLQLINFVK